MRNLTDQKIKDIRSLARNGTMRKHIAKKFGVSERTIGRVCQGVDKPEMRGIKSKFKVSKHIGFREDYEW